MSELGQTRDPKALVPGDPNAVRAAGAALTPAGELMIKTGDGLKNIEDGGWTGPAAERFRTFISTEPARWLKAGDSHHTAARTLTEYAGVLEWAQSEAANAITLWDQGERSQAGEVLQRARDQLVAAGNKAAGVINEAAGQAPDGTVLSAENAAVPSPQPGAAPHPGSFLDPNSPAILDAAKRFGIDPRALAALLIQEGEGRTLAANSTFGGFRTLEAQGLVGQTVGIGQMRPDLAARLAKTYFGQDLSPDQARVLLAYDDNAAINLAAANLHDLKERHGLTDEQAYTAYAADDKLIDAWRRGDGSYPGYGNMTQRANGYGGNYTEAGQIWGLTHPGNETPPAQPVRPLTPSPQPGTSPTPRA